MDTKAAMTRTAIREPGKLDRMFDAHEFQSRVDEAMVTVRRILDNDRAPVLPEDRSHDYADKFLLTERLVRLGLAAELNCLGFMLGTSGAIDEQWRVMRGWVAAGSSVTLRLTRTERCALVQTREREVVCGERQIEVSGNSFGRKTTKTEKTVRHEVETTWRLENQFEISAVAGGDCAENPLQLHGQVSQGKVTKTHVQGRKSQPPRPEVRHLSPLSVDITWLLQTMGMESLQVDFAISRGAAGCRTPRRNFECEAAVSFLDELSQWCGAIRQYFKTAVDDMHQTVEVETKSLFVPVVPLFEPERRSGLDPDSEPAPTAAQHAGYTHHLLLESDIHQFLAEQQASLLRRQAEIAKVFGSKSEQLITATEAQLMVGCQHAVDIAQTTTDCLGYVEEMLRQQLVAAVGKDLQAADLEEYMRWHDSHLFKYKFRPQTFCYAIRRGAEACPEGTLSIVGPDGGPVSTTVRHVPAEEAESIECRLHAGANIMIAGERFVHGLVRTQFEQQRDALTLMARARQFSSFMLLIGKLGPGANEFQQEHAIILQNKDELDIPMSLQQIPAAQAFKDSISSLSPAQRRFATAFRGMQLSGSVFAVVLLPLRPQLEVLLGLPPNALTKEIQLTQDLLTLLIEYQIPSDLFSVSDTTHDPEHSRLERVQMHVAELMKMIAEAKQQEIHDIFRSNIKKDTIARLANGASGTSESHVVGRVTTNVNRDSRVQLRFADGSESNEVQITMLTKPTEVEIHAFEDGEKAAQLAEEQQTSTSITFTPERTQSGLSSLFGRKRATRKNTPADDALHNIRKHVSTMQKRAVILEGKIATETRMARRHSNLKNKRDALISLKKKKLYDRELQQLINAIFQMEQQAMMLEQANMQASTVNAMSQGNKAMRAQMAATNLDVVEDAMDDILDEMEEEFLDESHLDMVLSDVAGVTAAAEHRTVEAPEVVGAEDGELGSDTDAEYSHGAEGTKHAPKIRLLQRSDDWTKLPKELDANFERLDVDAAVRPTKVRCGPEWIKRAKTSLLSKIRAINLGVEAQMSECNRAFDLLDALSRSGSLPIESASLHVLVAATHCFAHSLVETVINESVNPIEKVERTSLIMAAAVHRIPTDQLLDSSEKRRVGALSPVLFDATALEEARATAWPPGGRYPSWWAQLPPLAEPAPVVAITEDEEMALLEAYCAEMAQ